MQFALIFIYSHTSEIIAGSVIDHYNKKNIVNKVNCFLTKFQHI